MQAYVTGYFRNEWQAAEAVRVLVDAHFKPDDVGVIAAADGAVAQEIPVERKTGVPALGVTGAVLGAVLGAAGAALIAAGALPALPFALFSSSPLLAALQGGALGAAVGGLLGSLAGLAFWDSEPEVAPEIGAGAALVGVRIEEDRIEEARAALERAGARRVQVSAAPPETPEEHAARRMS
jgi:hypothetical protein